MCHTFAGWLKARDGIRRDMMRHRPCSYTVFTTGTCVTVDDFSLAPLFDLCQNLPYIITGI